MLLRFFQVKKKPQK